jgi:hypothetical protein
MSSKRMDATEKAPTTRVTSPVSTAPTLVRISTLPIFRAGTDRFHGELAPFDS